MTLNVTQDYNKWIGHISLPISGLYKNVTIYKLLLTAWRLHVTLRSPAALIRQLKL